MTLLGGDPIDLGGGWIGVQEAVHDGDAPGVYCDLVVLNGLVVTHRPIFELIFFLFPNSFEIHTYIYI